MVDETLELFWSISDGLSFGKLFGCVVGFFVTLTFGLIFGEILSSSSSRFGSSLDTWEGEVDKEDGGINVGGILGNTLANGDGEYDGINDCSILKDDVHPVQVL